MPLLGLIGYPIGHSFSPQYFSKLFESDALYDWEYHLFPLEHLSDLRKLIIENSDLIALNVTIPHKSAVLEICDEIDHQAELVGAANLLILKKENSALKIKAYNTDTFGFAKSLNNWYKPRVNKALVLGTGGSSKAVTAVLKQLGIPYEQTGRTSKPGYSDFQTENFDLIVNCTPVGMSGFEDQSNGLLPISIPENAKGIFFFDLVYNPSETVMMQAFRKAGAEVKNGYEMLKFQADKAWELIKDSYKESN